jgi:hypothetical protein
MPNRVCMVGAGHFEKLLEVIGRLPRLVLEIALSSGNELLVGVINLLVVAALVAAHCDRDSLGSMLWSPPIAFGAPLCAHAGCLEGHPSTAVGGRLPIALDKNSSNHLLD